MLASGDIFRQAFTAAGELGRDAVFIASISDNLIKAVVAFDNYTGVDVHIHLCCFGRYVPKAILRFVDEYAFGLCGCERMTAPVDSANTQMQKWIERVGFRREGAMRCMVDGRDLLIYGCLRGDYRYGQAQNSRPEHSRPEPIDSARGLAEQA